MDYLGKGEVLTNTDLDRFVNKSEKQKCCIYNFVQGILKYMCSQYLYIYKYIIPYMKIY